jgi:peptide/nickel transport system permease protein
LLLFVLRRLLLAIPTLLGVTLVVFALIHMAPGDPIDILVPPEASPEVIAQIKATFGLDKPLYVQYVLWLGHALIGQFGLSVFNASPVWDQLVVALPNTLELAAPAALFGFSSGIALGLLSAAHHGRWPDKVFSFITITGVSLPHYWFAMVLVMVCAALHDWLPAQGMGDDTLPLHERLQYLVLPTVTMMLIPMGLIGRLTRARVLDIMARDFVGALTAKGLTRWPVLKHVCKNAAPPVLALMGLQFGYLVAGSILVETVFNWPGAGNLLNLAIFRRDYPVLQALILVLAAFFVLLNLLVDVVQAAVDPRIRR